MKQFFKDFALRGLIGMGFGPLVLAIIYGILGACSVIDSVSVDEMVKGIVSITLMAFVAAGITAVYQTERLGLAFAIALHALVLYMDYAAVYLLNNWLSDGIVPFLIFTACFFVGFALIWLIIYLCTRHSTKKLNQKLKKNMQ